MDEFDRIKYSSFSIFNVLEKIEENSDNFLKNVNEKI
jgi:hypothetical protein